VPAHSLPRALWTTILIASGLGLLFIGQFIALIRVAPEDPRLTFKDAILATALWGHILPRVSRHQVTVCLAALGLAAVLGANLFIGGLTHWFNYLPGAKNKGAAVSSRF